MRVYLAGPITGVPDYRRRFADAAQAVAAAGHEPVSPTDAVPPADGSWEGWMRATTSLLTTTDGVALLPGWETSRGARIEHDWAASVGLPARPLAAWTASGGGAPVPVRIQRRRTRGWRAHAGAVYVGRPTVWANPVRVHRRGDAWEVTTVRDGELLVETETRREAHAAAVALYREHLERPRNPWWFYARREDVAALAGRDLMCWCPPGLPCHADVLLELANPADGGTQ